MRAGYLLALTALVASACGSTTPPAAPTPAPPTSAAVTTATPPTAVDLFVDSILRLMTLEEKAGQLVLGRSQWIETGPRVPPASMDDIRSGRVGSFFGIIGSAYARTLQRVAMEESRLKIPLMLGHDVIHGFRTIFPVPLAEAASWNPALVERASRIAAIEATAHGLHWTFAPMVDIARDPRWGRIVEGAGEDPYLGSLFSAARVRGFQGTDLSLPNTMIATGKHYVAYGAAEGGRDYNTADISERTLREIYLPPFQAAVDAGAQSIMAAFNEVAGVPMHAHDHLVNGVLRREWGFDGFVVSDYTGIMELIPHGLAANGAEAAAAAINAGIDIDLAGSEYRNDLPVAVRSGLVSESKVDESVGRVLRAKHQLGLFKDPYLYFDTVRERTQTLTPEHLEVARQLAREAIVLLKNERNTLPLRKDLPTIAVIGMLADSERVALGSWAAWGRAEDAVDVLAGIRQAVPRTRVLFARGTDVMSADTSGFAEAVRIARQADAVILVLGEHHDMSAEALNRTTLDLPGVQLELAKRVHAVGKPTVAVLMNGRPLSINWLHENVPAILETWFLGVQMGPAVADVLFGDYNPSGKLPVTFPRNVGQIPIYYNHKNTGRPPNEANKYTSKYIDTPWTPLYAFGYGLSYTTFAYSEPALSARSIRATDSLRVQVTVTNTGNRAGEEVAQLYIRDDVASITRPVMELRGFQKIMLRPGESRTLTFTIRPTDLAFHDKDMKRVVEPGTFTVFVGGRSDVTRTSHFVVEK